MEVIKLNVVILYPGANQSLKNNRKDRIVRNGEEVCNETGFTTEEIEPNKKIIYCKYVSKFT